VNDSITVKLCTLSLLPQTGINNGFFIFSWWGFSLQSHDCGFHMLMHAEHWDGQAICNFQKEDIADIRKLFTYRWLSHKDNETNWKAKIL